MAPKPKPPHSPTIPTYLLRRHLRRHALAGVQHTGVRALQLRFRGRKQVKGIQNIHWSQGATAGARQAADGRQRVGSGTGRARSGGRRALLRTAAGHQLVYQHLLLQGVLLRQRGQLRRGLQRHPLY